MCFNGYVIEQRLGEGRFIRIHRSPLVNIDRITALEEDAGSWFIRLHPVRGIWRVTV